MVNKMDHLRVTCLICLTVAGCSVNVNNNSSQFEYSENFSFAEPLAGRSQFSIDDINGTIVIVGDDTASQVVTTGTKRVQDESTEEAKSHIGDISIETSLSDSMVAISTHQPNAGGSRNYRVDYQIRLPKTWEVNVNEVNGTLEISHIENSVKTSLVNGVVTVTDLNGSFESLLTNGNITAHVTLPLDAKITMSTVNGNVSLAVPTSTSAGVSISVVNGSVSLSNLPMTVESNSRTDFKGTLGSGQGTITLSAMNGSIVLAGF